MAEQPHHEASLATAAAPEDASPDVELLKSQEEVSHASAASCASVSHAAGQLSWDVTCRASQHTARG